MIFSDIFAARARSEQRFKEVGEGFGAAAFHTEFEVRFFPAVDLFYGMSLEVMREMELAAIVFKREIRSTLQS